MKKLLSLTTLILIWNFTFSQPLKLSISSPQPRLTQSFNITIDITPIKKEIFKQIGDGLNLIKEEWFDSDPSITYSVIPKKLGRTEIAPLQFVFNGKTYTTEKKSFEVVEDLPKVASGLWFRKVPIDDSTFYIILEQNIPAKRKTTDSSDGNFSNTFVPTIDNAVKFKEFPDVQFYPSKGLKGLHIGGQSSKLLSYQNNDGELISYFYNIQVAKCRIDKNVSIKLTNDYFLNLPTDYSFNNINLP